MPDSLPVLNRRQIIRIVPFCAGCGLLAANSRAQNPAPATARHKFEEPCGFTFEGLFRFSFRKTVDILNRIGEQIGKDRVVEMVKTANAAGAAEMVKRGLEKFPKRTPDVFMAPVKSDPEFWNRVLTADWPQFTDKAVEARITECLWAKTFRELNAPELGYAIACHGDYAAVGAFNPKIKLTRTKTLMEGREVCNPRWVLEG